jgi:hypothetical protein
VAAPAERPTAMMDAQATRFFVYAVMPVMTPNKRYATRLSLYSPHYSPPNLNFEW